ncbi:tRNA 2-selenouridine(34) synthase MnmH [Gammaproteobacteria bacterium]|nr:tRNA 2-selenouridine(34) synthase MnmH [Gammaproteobacteria bacterium]
MKESALLTEVFEFHQGLIDLRAPIEFRRGTLPGAVNIPILEDAEREAIGKVYKQQGKHAALKKGFELVSDSQKEILISRWRDELSKYARSLIFCFRGGSRSEIAQDWLKTSGVDVNRIRCGYKSLRSELVNVLNQDHSLLLVGGKTGVGKTKILAEFAQAIDLENMAKHRGSAFGNYIESQPAQAQFENDLAVFLYKRRAQKKILVEDEGKLIGRIYIPKPFQQTMASSPMVVIEQDLDSRIQNIWSEYISDQTIEYGRSFGSEAPEKFREYLIVSVNKIKKKLGSQLHKEVETIVLKAFEEEKPDLHKEWIKILLERYYDPMYTHQLSQKKDRVIFSGTFSDVQAWIRSFYKT